MALSALLSDPAHAATFLVTSLADPAPATVPDCTNISALQSGTLRWAVVSANSTLGLDDVTVLVDGPVLLNTVCNAITFTDQVLWKSRPNFAVKPSAPNQGDAVVINMVQSSHVASFNRVVLLSDSSTRGSRGIRIVSGHLLYDSGWIRGFFGPAGWGGHGAGILVDPSGSASNLELREVYIYANRADASVSSDGGGIAFFGEGVLTIQDSLIYQNYAERRGGGIHFAGAAGVSMVSIIEHSTLWANEAKIGGGGLFIGAGGGGGIKLVNSTITGNKALDLTADGGGISVGRGPLELSFVTLADNTAAVGTQISVEFGPTDVNGSVFSGAFPVCSGAVDGSKNTLSSDQSCNPIQDIVGAPLLGALNNNGGTCGGIFHACLTHEPQPASPLIDASSTCPSGDEDQRHFTRSGAPCWIGSYED